MKFKKFFLEDADLTRQLENKLVISFLSYSFFWDKNKLEIDRVIKIEIILIFIRNKELLRKLVQADEFSPFYDTLVLEIFFWKYFSKNTFSKTLKCVWDLLAIVLCEFIKRNYQLPSFTISRILFAISKTLWA